MTGQRILLLATDAFGGYGGIAQYNRDVVTAMAASSAVDQICVLPRNTPGALSALPEKAAQLRPRPGRIAYVAVAVAAAWRMKPTIVLAGHLYHSGLAKLVARLVGAKLIVQLHGTEIWHGLAPSHRRALEAADQIFAVSRDTGARIRTRAMVDPARIVVLNNTVGEEFTPGDRVAARARFSLGDELAILTVSRLDRNDGYKGHDRIMPLIARLRNEGVAVVYLVAGAGPHQQELKALAHRHGIDRQVRFLGHVAREDQPDLYRAADIFALPSTGEGFGIVFLEAMACGTPTIGLAVGGAPDALGDGELGRCVDPEQFADAFMAMAVNARQRDATLAARVQDRFGMALFVAQVDRIMRAHTASPDAASSDPVR